MKTNSKADRASIAGKAGLLSRLQGGDRRSIGYSNEIAALVLSKPRLFPDLMEGMWHDDPIVRMRAADAELRPAITELLRRYTSSGTPAMKARGRKLLARLCVEEVC